MLFILTASVLTLAGCGFPLLEAGETQPNSIAIIGDIDLTSHAGKQVSTLVQSRSPKAVITTGDNAYNLAGYKSFESSPYQPYIDEGLFFPALGNHDYDLGLDEYLRFFPHILNASNYSQRVGNIDFFFIDSMKAISSDASNASQYQWLTEVTSTSDAKYKIVVFHNPPYTSGTHHGPAKQLRWNFEELGISAVISGHEHIYERLSSKGITFLISGLGGKSLYHCGDPIKETEFCTDNQSGALFMFETPEGLHGQFVDVEGRVMDSFQITTIPK